MFDEATLEKITMELLTNLGYETLNGYEYAEGGIALGVWVITQRQAYKGQGTNKITEIQIKLLEEIRMKWFLKIRTDKKIKKK